MALLHENKQLTQPGCQEKEEEEIRLDILQKGEKIIKLLSLYYLQINIYNPKYSTDVLLICINQFSYRRW